MNTTDIVTLRLHNQHLLNPTFKKPVDVVSWLGAVQSQDYTGAKWGLGLRSSGLTDADIDRAFNDGSILRTHVMRPTWHFVSPKDIRWLLSLTAPRVLKLSAYYYRKLELDDSIFTKSQKVITRALSGGKQLTRDELRDELNKNGIAISKKDYLLRTGFIMGHAELDGIICSGGKRGKQFTYALLEERVPQTKKLSHDESLAELTLRYFTSHGPATAKDFVWWSGLSSADVKTGIEMVKDKLIYKTINETSYWFSDNIQVPKQKTESAHFLSNYDEYTIGYANHDDILDREYFKKWDFIAFAHVIIINGKIIGGWKRIIKKDKIEIKISLFEPITKSQKEQIAKAAKDYSKFLQKPIDVLI